MAQQQPEVEVARLQGLLNAAEAARDVAIKATAEAVATAQRDTLGGVGRQLRELEEALRVSQAALEAKTAECARLTDARAADAETFTLLRQEAVSQLETAELHVAQLSKDLSEAWDKQGVLEHRMQRAAASRKLVSLAEHKYSTKLRKALRHWAAAALDKGNSTSGGSNSSGSSSSKSSSYEANKPFPRQLGPFSMTPTALTATLTLQCQPEIGYFGYQVPLEGEQALWLKDLTGDNFQDQVLDCGQSSAPHPITLTPQARRLANVHQSAATVTWCYPLVGMAETSKKFALSLEKPEVRFLTFGGFAYCDGGGKVCQTLALGQGDGLHFEPPQPWRHEFTQTLAQQGRYQTITIDNLADAGAKYYCWVHPGEVLTNDLNNSSWEVAPHGAFCYLFNEPNEPHDPRNCFMGVWGNKRATAGGVSSESFKQIQAAPRLLPLPPPPSPPVPAPAVVTTPSSSSSSVSVQSLLTFSGLEHESGVTQFEFTREGALGFGIKRSSTRVLDSDGGGDGVSSGGGGNSGDNGQKKGMIVIIHVAAGGQAANLGLTVGDVIVQLAGNMLDPELPGKVFMEMLSALDWPMNVGVRKLKTKHRNQASEATVRASLKGGAPPPPPSLSSPPPHKPSFAAAPPEPLPSSALIGGGGEIDHNQGAPAKGGRGGGGGGGVAGQVVRALFEEGPLGMVVEPLALGGGGKKKLVMSVKRVLPNGAAAEAGVVAGLVVSAVGDTSMLELASGDLQSLKWAYNATVSKSQRPLTMVFMVPPNSASSPSSSAGGGGGPGNLRRASSIRKPSTLPSSVPRRASKAQTTTTNSASFGQQRNALRSPRAVPKGEKPMFLGRGTAL